MLVQVPRRGYVPALACGKCRTIARCRYCTGPLSLPDAVGLLDSAYLGHVIVLWSWALKQPGLADAGRRPMTVILITLGVVLLVAGGCNVQVAAAVRLHEIAVIKSRIVGG